MYTVWVDDNFHYMDESNRYELGKYESLAAAIAAAKRIVDEYLLSAYKHGITADQLYHSYVSFGEDPFIIPSEGNEILFSAWNYAKARCQELCEPNKQE